MMINAPCSACCSPKLGPSIDNPLVKAYASFYLNIFAAILTMQLPRIGTAVRICLSSLFKESLGGSIARRLTRPIVKPLLKEALMDTLQVGLLIEDFVYRIWGFHPDRLQWEKFFQDLQLDQTLVEEYKATFQHSERYRYAPFARLIDSIVAKLVEVLKPESPLPVSFEPLGSTYIRSGRRNRKPDIGIIGKRAVEEYRLAQDGLDKHSKAQLRWETVGASWNSRGFFR